jgi:hypothetical protein
MHRTLVITAVSFVALTISTNLVKAEALTVETFSHAPNYSLCTDPEDHYQLTDGVLTSFPIWKNKQTVGWAAVTPVAIRLRITSSGLNKLPQDGIVRLHTAKGLSAGVDVPREIDVYTRDPDGRFRLVGSLVPDSGALADKSSHWLKFSVNAVTDTLVVVIHASGDYLFVDEIEWRPAGSGQLPLAVSSLPDMKAVLDDSTRRTREGLSRAAEADLARLALSLDPGTMRAWVEDPWGKIDPRRAREHLERSLSVVQINGFASEHESLCIGVVAGSNSTAAGLLPSVEGLPAGAVRVFEVRSVVAANGQRVYDPLIPLNASTRIDMRTGVPVYVWFDVDLAVLGPGKHRFTIRLEATGHTISVDGIATVNAYDGSGVKPLRAVNWAYLSDRPIFQDPEVAIRDLTTHGINTFVVHPTDIPGLALDGSWNPAQAAKLAQSIALAKQRGMLLLFLGWTADKNPLGFSTTHRVIDVAARDRLLRWVVSLAAYLTEQGLSHDQWALYPVDEPNLQGLHLIKAVAEIIKHGHQTVRLYSDLSAFANPAVGISDLEKVRYLVDFWQPSLAVVRGHLGPWFTGLQREWWIYSNPKSPAKLASPLHDFRMLAWWAWYYRARGVGFWSYSDTNGSSAWDDLDSRRPDWAVVYESVHGVVSSRRWEAFREGLEDYILLVGLRGTSEQVERVGKPNFDQWDMRDVDSIRSLLLGAPRTHLSGESPGQ